MQLSAEEIKTIENFFQLWQVSSLIYIGPEQPGISDEFKFLIMLKAGKRKARLKKIRSGYRMKRAANKIRVWKDGTTLEITAWLKTKRVAIPGIWRPGEKRR